MSAKPLYLDGRQRPLSVSLLGQALRIGAIDASDALCPLARLDHVQCWGDVHWHAEAIVACGQRAIPIAFRKGFDAAAVVMPHQVRARSFAAILEAAATAAKLAPRIEDWIAHESSRARLDALARVPELATSLERDLRRFRRRVMPLHETWLCRRLLDRGVGAPWLGASSARPNLLRAFGSAGTETLSPLVYRLALYARERPAAMAGEARIWSRAALMFQAEIPALDKRFQPSWARFEMMVRDLAELEEAWAG